MNRIGYLLSLSLLIQTVALGVSFAECHTEEEAIDWLKEKLSTMKRLTRIHFDCKIEKRFMSMQFNDRGGQCRNIS